MELEERINYRANLITSRRGLLINTNNIITLDKEICLKSFSRSAFFLTPNSDEIIRFIHIFALCQK